MIKQTAEKDQLGEFAPNFAHYNDIKKLTDNIK